MIGKSYLKESRSWVQRQYSGAAQWEGHLQSFVRACVFYAWMWYMCGGQRVCMCIGCYTLLAVCTQLCVKASSRLQVSSSLCTLFGGGRSLIEPRAHLSQSAYPASSGDPPLCTSAHCWAIVMNHYGQLYHGGRGSKHEPSSYRASNLPTKSSPRAPASTIFGRKEKILFPAVIRTVLKQKQKNPKTMIFTKMFKCGFFAHHPGAEPGSWRQTLLR